MVNTTDFFNANKAATEPPPTALLMFKCMECEAISTVERVLDADPIALPPCQSCGSGMTAWRFVGQAVLDGGPEGAD